MCRVTRELPAPIQLPSSFPLAAAPSARAQAFLPATAKNVFVKSTVSNRIESKQAFASRSSNIYELGPVLREGKFGAIHLASVLKSSSSQITQETSELYEHSSSEKPVALKIYSMERMKDLRSNAIENPWLEIEIQGLLGQQRHPNLVGMIESCIIESNLFIVMPFFSGGDLLEVMETRFGGSALPVTEAKRMFSQVLSGLQFLHNNGIVHRDLSIENILYDQENNNFAICDFGLATRVPQDPATGMFLPLSNAPICGKDGYVAPCLWRRDEFIDLLPTDIWSMGIILFMTLTGSAPLQRAVEWDPYYQLICNKQLLDLFGDSSLDQETRMGLELVQTILDPVPVNRPTVNELVAHPWLKMI